MTAVPAPMAAALALLAGAAIACSRVESGLETAKATSPLPTVAQEDAGAAWTSSDAGLPDDRGCYALANERSSDRCASCCVDVYPAEWATTWDSLRACACRKPQPTCAKVCGASYCAGALSSDDASQACATCLVDAWNGADYDCSVAWATTCNADDRCAAFSKCTAACDPAPSASEGAR